MAVFRGQNIASEPSQSRLKRPQQLKDELLASATPDPSKWEVFLDEAGGVDLSALGESIPQNAGARRNQVADVLIDFLSDPNWNRRDSAARILEAMGAREAVPKLRELLYESTEVGLVRRSAFRALEGLGGLLTDELPVLRIDPSPLIQEEAERLLIEIENQETKMASVAAEKEAKSRHE